MERQGSERERQIEREREPKTKRQRAKERERDGGMKKRATGNQNTAALRSRHCNAFAKDYVDEMR